MYELIKINNSDFFISSPTNIGLLIREECGYLIDSGNDKDAGRRVKKILEENRIKLKAILNTHSHADHIGGNRYLENNTGCKIYASDAELGFIRNPILEPSLLYGGCPSDDLKHKFLYAERSDAGALSDALLPKGVKTLDLKGHSIGMLGFLTEEGTAYIADSVSCERTIKKYKIGYIYNVKEYLKTLDYLKSLNVKVFIPSHAERSDDITELIELNRKSVLDTVDLILSILKEAKGFEEILSDVFSSYDLTMSAEQYVLIGSTIKGYLTYLRGENLIDAEYLNNKMVFKRL